MVNRDPNYYVAGIGASAGGLQAVTELLAHLPARFPMALVLVQHLDRYHPSELAEILTRSGQLPATWITDPTPLLPGHVYVLPPDREVTIEQRILHLGQRREEAVVGTVDYFFESLALGCKDRAIAIILSGTGSDGAKGLRAVKEAGGRVFVQEESTAAFPGMLRAAIESGEIDGVFSPKQIAEQLIGLASPDADELEISAPFFESDPIPHPVENWMAIFRVVSSRKGVDFSGYKQSTIRRRLMRRMALSKTEQLPDYLKLLLRDRNEVEGLYENLLINVTNFFRDPEYFEFLKEQIIPDLLAQHAADNSPIRVWVPGCSTGEEAYSLGMLFQESREANARSIPVHIFATDLSERAIAHARNGIFSPADVAGIGPERLRRFFLDTPRGYAVKKSLRDMCIFARQNVTKDLPFSRLDLISCRNLLIYLGDGLQKRLMPIFHYALNPQGYLMLGTSESIGSQVDLFRLVDRRFRIYSRKSSATRRVSFDFAVEPTPVELTSKTSPVIPMPDDPKDSVDIMREADRVVLGRHAPPGVLVNEELEILQFRGNVAPYLAPMAGRASLSLLKMAAEGLAAELERAVMEAKEKKVRIHRRGIRFTQGQSTTELDLDVTPLDGGRDGTRYYLLLFLVQEPAERGKPKKTPPVVVRGEKIEQREAVIEQLKQDLQAARNYLQSTIEKHEVTNQELRAANEEIQSSNEELQSTNEELETAKEELQSTNEELTTVNEELHSRQGELIQVNNDLTNLINSVHLPIIILGQDMRIRRFTPMAEQVLNVIPTDVGRPLSDLNINLSVTDLPRLISEVIDSLTIREMEVQDHQGHWYSMRLRPYKTAENRIEGVVMTLIDIDEIKRTIGELEEARHFASEIGEILPEALVAVNSALEIRVASQAFHGLFGTSRAHSYGHHLLNTVPVLREAPGFKETLAAALASGENVKDFVTEVAFPLTGKRTFLVTVRQASGATKANPSLLISFRPEENAPP